MNKSVFIEHLKFALEQQLLNATAAANSARADATHEQSAAETQYDSLSIEYGYLVRGKAKGWMPLHRRKEIVAQLQLQHSNTVGHNSLVELIDESNQSHWFYLAPCEGGLKVACKGQTVMVLTFAAPLGQQLRGCQVDDEFTFAFNGRQQSLCVAQIL